MSPTSGRRKVAPSGQQFEIAFESERAVVVEVGAGLRTYSVDENGVLDGYGVEERWQSQGYASEATRACVDWALEQTGITCVTATTPPWHTASIRVLEKSGLIRSGIEEHDTLGEVLRFTRQR